MIVENYVIKSFFLMNYLKMFRGYYKILAIQQANIQ